MAEQTIQISALVNFDEDTGGVPESEMDSVLRDQIKDHFAAIGRHYDGITVTGGAMTSSLSGTETF